MKIKYSTSEMVDKLFKEEGGASHPEIKDIKPEKKEDGEEEFGSYIEDQNLESDLKGIEEYKQALDLESIGEYDEAAYLLKETMRELKSQGQHNTMSYLYLLRRLAWV